MEKELINSVNNFLDEYSLSTIRKHVNSSSLEEQYQWWLNFKKKFKDSPTPSKEQIQGQKDFFERELSQNPKRLTTDDTDRHLQNLFAVIKKGSTIVEDCKALDPFFTTPHHLWGEQRKINQSQQYEHQKDNNRQEINKLIKKNIQVADALIEAYPFRYDIIKVIEQPKKER